MLNFLPFVKNTFRSTMNNSPEYKRFIGDVCWLDIYSTFSNRSNYTIFLSINKNRVYFRNSCHWSGMGYTIFYVVYHLTFFHFWDHNFFWHIFIREAITQAKTLNDKVLLAEFRHCRAGYCNHQSESYLQSLRGFIWIFTKMF